jgi:ABC-2 type transport system permease protein
MNGLRLALRQVAFENRAFWRNPAAAFFTFVMPLFFLVLFNALFGDNEFQVPGGTVSESVFYVPGIAAMGVISACYTNIAMMVSVARDLGVLKRVRGTPLPAWAYLLGRIGQATFVAVLLVVVITLAGAVLYDVDAPTNTLPAFIVTVAVAAAAFCALGLALTALIPNSDASPAIVNASILPLFFISNVFIQMDDPPGWVEVTGNVFPVKHFANALGTVFNPYTEGAGFEWGHLAVIALWGAAGAVLALRFFSWEPRR